LTNESIYCYAQTPVFQVVDRSMMNTHLSQVTTEARRSWDILLCRMLAEDLKHWLYLSADAVEEHAGSAADPILRARFNC